MVANALQIAVYDFVDPVKPTVVATGNVVKENYLEKNEFDIMVASTGAGNVAKKVCLTRIRFTNMY